MFDSLMWQQIVEQFHFIRPWWLLALLPLALLVYLRWKQDSKNEWQDVLPEHLRSALTINDMGWKKQLPLKLLSVSMFIAIIVCAGPTWEREPSPFGEDKAALLIVLDNSPSMLQKDLAPSRLERSKQKIRDLLNERKGGKTGLVVFSGSAHLAMPLTKDNLVFAPFLAAINPDIMPVEGKSAESALALIEPQLGDNSAGTVLLISDGVNPKTIQAYEEYFQNSSHQLLVLAAGNKDKVSDNPMDLSSLQTLARKSNGSVVEVTVDDRDIQSLNNKIQRHMQLNNESAMPWKDMGYYLLFLVALLMLSWFRKGWLVKWCLVVCVVFPTLYSTPTYAENVSLKAKTEEPVSTVTLWQKITDGWMDLWLTADQQGQWYFEQSDYLKAAKQYQDPLKKGTAYYYAGEYQLAHSAFLQVKSDLGLFNAANALARQREYVAARDIFQGLLTEDIDSELREKTENNLSVMQGIVDEVNRTSESQKGTTDGPEESFELAEDQPKTGDGADEEVDASLMTKESLNANEILGSQELADKWLRRVEADPKYFLRAKFQLQRYEQTRNHATDTVKEK
ncbi:MULTISPECIES: vWA domain-containing protein [Aliivibrio]|uniref:VWA domain-containing protein n=1 Tax=Aliivibrio finisterrensis TaxID=511998 RepID=A0A4V1Z8T5_9GAMM|nr:MULTISPECIES: VWA domain-containing protein [Aliivibrio]MDD9177653.1 VWA domain-containing protein [Aliivibrio sp. A6]RYU51263.1 VWA domain-containing protein [Aliivibrio finisterrensis]RYU54460.1 VWA domain-containing protein [Aliivibrio finisterrensis]RYU59528.1 VWA domain-containing protein [Aliivibrio finisterrensis]RYU65457.1 VWA domain-containing protein [Aliivibrio finisterrensis]